MDQLSRWKIFKDLYPEFAAQVKVAFTAGGNESGYLVTKDENVYRNRMKGCSGGTPVKIAGLCGKEIKDFRFYYRGDYITEENKVMVALSQDGSVFEWSGTAEKPIPRVLLGGVAQMEGAYTHMVALTSDGHVFAWGDNGRGQLGADPRKVKTHRNPARVHGFRNPTTQSAADVGGRGGTSGAAASSEPKIISIACGLESSFAVTADGKLWGWGDSKSIGNGKAHATPRIILDGSVTQVAFGWFHVFIVRGTEKALYFWNCLTAPPAAKNPHQPIRKVEDNCQVGPIIDGVCDIGTSIHSPLMAIQVEGGGGVVYILMEKDNSTIALKTGYTSVDESFASERFPTMCRAVRIRSFGGFRDLDDRQTADVCFSLAGCEGQIYAHSRTLRRRSQNLSRPFVSHQWGETSEATIGGRNYTMNKVAGFTCRAFRTFLGSLYLGTVEPLDLATNIELLRLLHHFGAKELQEQYEQFLQADISDENAAELYGLAVEFDAKLRKACLEFITPRYSAVKKTLAYGKLAEAVKARMEQELSAKQARLDTTDTDTTDEELASEFDALSTDREDN